MKILEPGLRMARYHIADISYKLKDKSPREDAFLDRLRANGLSMPGLNLHLDRAGFPQSVGRFPEILARHDRLIDSINQFMVDFAKNSEYGSLPLEQKRRTLFDYVSGQLSETLALDPRVFDQYRIDNKFRMSRAI